MTKKPFRVIRGHRRPKPPFRSTPPARTREARTTFAQEVAAQLPGTWRVESDAPETITFKAEFRGTRGPIGSREKEYTAPIRVLRRDPRPGALLLVWAAQRTENGQPCDDRTYIAHDDDVYIAGLLDDDRSPAALGRAIEYADHHGGVTTHDDERVLEHTAYHFHAENRSTGGTGWSATWVAADIAEKFLPRYLKELPRLLREKAQHDKVRAKQENRRAEAQQRQEALEATITATTAQLRALGYRPLPSDPDTFYPPSSASDGRRQPPVFLTGSGMRNYVNANVVIRMSQLPTLLRCLGYQPPKKPKR